MVPVIITFSIDIMRTLKYKTNINCNGCVKSVTPFLNELDEVDKWKVDIDNSDKVLEVVLESGNSSQIIKAVQKAGFDIEEINE